MELSDRVRNKRIELGLTQDELAKRMGYKSRVSINKIENGREVSQKIIVRLAEVLNTTPSYLMGWDDEEKQVSNVIGNGELFKQLLKRKNVTIMEVAKEIHIPAKELQQYELGLKRIPFDVIKKLADYFEVDITTLQGFEVRGGNNNFNTSVRLLEITDRWSKEIGHVEFTDEELTQLINYAKFILSQRKEEK